jgi:hypothetical protein
MYFQIPRYIITLHELLAHTPHDHVERNSLEYAKSKLEELSKVSCCIQKDTGICLSPEMSKKLRGMRLMYFKNKLYINKILEVL